MTRPAPIIAGILAALLLLFGAYMGAYFVVVCWPWPFEYSEGIDEVLDVAFKPADNLHNSIFPYRE